MDGAREGFAILFASRDIHIFAQNTIRTLLRYVGLWGAIRTNTAQLTANQARLYANALQRACNLVASGWQRNTHTQKEKKNYIWGNHVHINKCACAKCRECCSEAAQEPLLGYLLFRVHSFLRRVSAWYCIVHYTIVHCAYL